MVVYGPKIKDKTLHLDFTKAKFTSQVGSALFNNPELDESNDYIKKLNSNPVRTLPKTGKIGITTSGSLSSTLVAGRKIASPDTNKVGSAVITGSGGEATTPTVVSGLGGKNYVNDTNVDTFAITGKGTGLKLNITQTNGAITSASVVSGSAGFGYQVGDVVGIVTSTVTGATGSGAQIKNWRS